jgi:hypothetical protein
MRQLRLALLGLAFTAVSVVAQQNRPAKPGDLEGVWDFSLLTPLQRTQQYADKAFLTPDEAVVFERTLRQGANSDRRGATAEADLNGAAINEFWLERGDLARVNGRIPASLIVDPLDGRIPPLTPEVQRRLAERRLVIARADAPEDRSLSERCLRAASGPPYVPSPDANTLRIVQSRDAVALTAEKFHETRIVALDARPHLRPSLRSWVGDAVGRWEGNTLVVDTINFTLKIGGNYDGNLHLTERFTRSDSNALLYEVTIEDATAFVQPWTARLPMKKVDGPLYEFACHEGNYSLPNILRGARVEEQRMR